MATWKAQMAPKRAQVGLLDRLTGSVRALNGQNMPRWPSQTARDLFWGKPFLTILGPKTGHLGGPVRRAALTAWWCVLCGAVHPKMIIPYYSTFPAHRHHICSWLLVWLSARARCRLSPSHPCPARLVLLCFGSRQAPESDFGFEPNRDQVFPP